LTQYLEDAGFTAIVRVEKLGVFDDTSNMEFKLPISLNMVAGKPASS
jgi:hypothetical protein